MNKQSGKSQNNPSLAVAPGAAESDAARLLARARTMMIISVLTTGLAIAAVAAVVAYRIMGVGGSGGNAANITSGTLFLPPGAKVVSTAASGGRIMVTLDIGGSTEVRIFDLKTLQQTGQLRFGTEH